MIHILPLVFILLSSASCSFVQHGSVGGGNYSHYIINEPEAFTLKLYSFKGDADLYVSESIRYPTFELDEHSFQSVTCGVDSLFIDDSVSRPIYVGVYGHPNHALSNFVLELSSKSDSGRDKRRESLFLFGDSGPHTWVLNNIVYFTKMNGIEILNFLCETILDILSL
uniref:C6orf120 homolog n=1 Tax=Caligus rogercresseyi TaxID=217165 RepID=C1BMU3_CALRO|nr:C6orf120 homolog precursor [Caligus rogercresseyi]ACO11265.1 C6orf120 homolog precursor [Caligus rogercresseyi]|eukprot:TRINITY_DN1584_c0_g1_i1.p1 TRINITY_DN1584_c0_g1~~TRINITY_DN1584_c0_g1_i1.p1  ORF type:complete len:168 (-),score=44.64 TRINITY_DN1584_c0_g1_i1:12-515(-)